MVVVAACGGGSDASDGPRLRVVVSESLQQANCEPRPIQVIEYPSGESVSSQPGQYLNLAISPSGATVAAVESVCGVEDAPPFWTLQVFNATDLSVRTTIPDVPLPATIDWSPSSRFIAVLGLGEAAVYDVDADGTLFRQWPLAEAGGVPQRWQIAWPSGGHFMLMYLEGSSLVGVPTNADGDLRRWTLKCENGEPTRPVSLQTTPDGSGVEVFVVCGSGATGYSMFEVSGVSGNVSGGAFTATNAPQGFSFETVEAVRDEFPGSAMRFGPRLGADRELSFGYLMYSPSGDVEQVWADDRVVRSDTENLVAVQLPSGQLVFVPITLNVGPLLRPELNFMHDVVVLHE